MHAQAEGPDDHRTRCIEHHPVDAGQCAGDRDPSGVVSPTGDEIEKDGNRQVRVVPYHHPGVEGVLGVALIGARHHHEERVHHGNHAQHSPVALQPNHLHGWQVQVLHEELLRNDLRRLHHLAQDHHAHSQDHVGLVAARIVLRAEDVRNANERHSTDAEEQPQPVEAQHFPLEEQDGENGREHDRGPTQHLPYAGRDVEHAVAAEASGQQVEDGRQRHHHDLRGVGWPPARPRRLIDQRLSSVGSGWRAAFPGDQVGDSDQGHGTHHVKGSEPWLLELLHLPVQPDAELAELDLGGQRVQRPGEKHA
mmetsp:Transcript_5548/g.14094  ORF Transcript_5548/g.14094 Transcript_5548/m.14094 type:complete len:308 (+) Transcript_5548:525-1448(+)